MSRKFRRIPTALKVAAVEGSAAPPRAVVVPRRTSHATRATIRRRVRVVCLLLAAATLVVFGRSLFYPFLEYLDTRDVSRNLHVRTGVSVENALWVFTHGYASHWQPLTWLSHMVDCQFYDLRPWGHHASGLLLHTATTVLLFLVLLRMLGRLGPSALAAALFALHPLRVEAVVWIAARGELLGGLFLVLTLGAYLRYVARPQATARYAILLAVYALGLLATPLLFSLPLVLLLLDYWPLWRFEPPGLGHPETRSARLRQLAAAARPLLVEKIPLVLLAAGACTLSLLAARHAAAVVRLPVGPRLAEAAIACVAYLGQTVWPFGLAVVYPLAPTPPPFLYAKMAAALVLLAALTAAAIAARKKHPYLLVGWLWYLVSVTPVLGIVPLGLASRADRDTYLSQIGLYLAAAMFTANLAARRRWGPRVWPAATLAVTVLLALCAWQQTSYWRDRQHLWQHALDCTSGNYVAYSNLGSFFWDAHDSVQAQRYLQTARELCPHYAPPYGMLGVILAAEGDAPQAAAYLQKALELDPDDSESHDQLAMLEEKAGRFDAAAVHFRAALAGDPGNKTAHKELAAVLLRQHKADEAVLHCRAALRLDGNFSDARATLGLALSQQGQVREAVECFRAVLDDNPESATAHAHLADLLCRQENLPEAIDHYRRALQLDPRQAATRSNLAVTLFKQGKVAEAIGYYHEILQTEPDDFRVLNNLGLALYQQGKVEEAIVHFRRSLAIAPRNAMAYGNLGLALVSRGRSDEAVQAYAQAVALEPASSKHQSALGTLLYRRGQTAAAVAHWREASRLAPQDAVLLNQLAWVLATDPEAALRNGREAIALALRADHESGGNMASILDTLAAAYAEAGRFAEAVSTIDRAISLALDQSDVIMTAAYRARRTLYQARQPFHASGNAHAPEKGL